MTVVTVNGGDLAGVGKQPEGRCVAMRMAAIAHFVVVAMEAAIISWHQAVSGLGSSMHLLALNLQQQQDAPDDLKTPDLSVELRIH